ncbi:MAG: DUF6174 domain-containing protein [bacterium]
MPWLRIHRSIVVAALLAQASCSSTTQAISDLTVARQRWQAGRPVAYDYTLNISCFCGTEITRAVIIVVRNNTVESRTYADNGQAVAATFNSSFPTMDGFFDVLVSATARNPYRMDAAYDPVLGYPTHANIDFERDTADEEMFYQISSFHVR